MERCFAAILAGVVMRSTLGIAFAGTVVGAAQRLAAADLAGTFLVIDAPDRRQLCKSDGRVYRCREPIVRLADLIGSRRSTVSHS
jgi:hypothetical protein